MSYEQILKLEGKKRTLPAIKETDYFYSVFFCCIDASQMFLMERKRVWFNHDLGSV